MSKDYASIFENRKAQTLEPYRDYLATLDFKIASAVFEYVEGDRSISFWTNKPSELAPVLENICDDINDNDGFICFKQETNSGIDVDVDRWVEVFDTFYDILQSSCQEIEEAIKKFIIYNPGYDDYTYDCFLEDGSSDVEDTIEESLNTFFDNMKTDVNWAIKMMNEQQEDIAFHFGDTSISLSEYQDGAITQRFRDQLESLKDKIMASLKRKGADSLVEKVAIIL